MRVALAGVDSRTLLDLVVRVRAPSVCLPYSHLRKRSDWGAEFLEVLAAHDVWVLVDSGGHALRSRYPWFCADAVDESGEPLPGSPFKAKQIKAAREKAGNPPKAKVLEELEAYHVGFLQWVREQGARVSVCGELDLDSIVGERVWEWRAELQEALGENAAERMVVTPHHLQDWDRLLSGEYRYLGLSGMKRADIQRFFTAHRRALEEKQICVHGWGMTTVEAVQHLPFYSVSSMSWLAGQKHGLTYDYQGSYLLRCHKADHKGKREGLRERCEESGVDHASLVADQHAAVTHWNALQWAAYATDLEGYTVNAYWLTPEERARLREEEVERTATSSAMERHEPQDKIRPADAEVLQYARYCDTCFISGKCPAHQVGATCRLFQRLRVENPQQLQDMLYTLLGVQGERILFGLFAEKVGGTTLDDRLSKEMRQLIKMIGAMSEIGQESFSIKAKGGPGVISQLLGAFKDRQSGGLSSVVDAKASAVKKPHKE